MADGSTAPVIEDDAEESPKPKKKTALDTELGGRKKIAETLCELYEKIDGAFKKAAPRINDQIDYWHIYNCEMTDNQSYNGTASVYVPLVRDAIDARVTRFTNQVFPQSGRNIQIVTSETKIPFETEALLEHYVRTAELRSVVVPALLRNGDVEGQWNVYVAWNKTERKVRYRVKKPITVDELVEVPGEDVDDIEETTIAANSPVVEVVPDTDVMILPQTADTVAEALFVRGGSVTIIRRWTKGDIKRMIADGDFIEARGEELIDVMDNGDKQRVDIKKKHADSAGIRDGGKYYLGYEVWTMLKVDGEQTLCRAFMADGDTVLGVKQNPFWHGMCPLLSRAVNKISGAMKGISPIKKVATFQYQANDIANQGFDSATYAMLPIVMTDPLKNPRVGSMVMNLAAVWEVDPNSTKFASFPQLWKDALGVVSECRSQVFQSLSVNPSMIPGQTGGKKKLNQAEVANEQQVDIMTTADVVTALEAGILNPLASMFAWLDMQYREDTITVQMYGRQGLKAIMQEIEPIQMDTRYEFQWLGVETARSSQQIQQQIAFTNVLNGIPPEKIPGRKIDLVPMIERAVENVFGPRLAPLIFQDITDQMAIDPMLENEMLEWGHTIPISPMDNDVQHLQIHQQGMAQTLDPHGVFKLHMMAHMQALQEKQMQQMQAPPPGGAPGGPNMPAPGAMPAGPRQMKQPAGAVHPDQMPLAMPRKM